jgi:hypothetical protein
MGRKGNWINYVAGTLKRTTPAAAEGAAAGDPVAGSY